MAAGDVFSGGPTSVAAGAYLDIQPGAGVEAVITNIFYGGAVEIYYYDGAQQILAFSDVSAGAVLNSSFHVVNARRIRVKNVTGAAIYIGYDGVQTK